MWCCVFIAMEMRIKSGRSNLFRSRKQNTSRPPSMHVDDFMRVSPSSLINISTHMCRFYLECVFKITVFVILHVSRLMYRVVGVVLG